MSEKSMSEINYEEIAGEYGTPVFVTREETIRERYQKIRDAFASQYEKLRVYYACKANTNLEILRILDSEGSYIDAVSAGEVFLARKAGFGKEHILFTGNNMDDEQLKYVVEQGVTINIDSFSELKRLVDIGKVPISFRINPKVGSGHHEHVITGVEESKFGIHEDIANEVFDFAIEKGFDIRGVHMHIGSKIFEIDYYKRAIKNLLKAAGSLKERGVDLEFIDIGGGFGIPYRPEEKEVDLEEFAGSLVESFRSGLEKYNLGEPILGIEPGRYIVADSTELLTTVNTVKRTPTKNFVGVDAGFHIFPRPILYDSYHGVRTVVERKEKEVYSIAGQICESGDILAKDRELSKIEVGDLLLFENAGAYCFSMASEYNSHPLPAEVLVSGKNHRLIRRRASFEDLLRNQEKLDQEEG